MLRCVAAEGPWTAVPNASFQAKTQNGGLQVFSGFEATSRYWRWNITHTGGNQPWVKEVQFRKAAPKADSVLSMDHSASPST